MNTLGTVGLLISTGIGVPLSLSRAYRRIGILALLIGLIGIGFFVWRDGNRTAGFESVALGMSEMQVQSTIGAPPRVTDGTEWVEPGYKRAASELVPGCVREYWYSAFLYPDALSLCFNASGKLIHKARYSSW